MDKSTEQKIKDAARVVDVVGDFVELRKKGVNYEGICPFHDDTSLGNFYVSPKKNVYKCFACGEGGDAIQFLMKKEKLTYHEALQYLAQKYCIVIDDDYDKTKFANIKPAKPRSIDEVIPKRDMLTLPRQLVKDTTGPRRTEHNLFCSWLRHLPWDTEMEKARLEHVLWLYCVGAWNDGRVIFWQIDHEGRVRSGKLMKYMMNGHRDKARNPGWMHNQQGVRETVDFDKYEYRATLFGMHLLKRYPNAIVHLVESEKTALICATHYGDMEHNLWLACGGMKFLKMDTLTPLFEQGRHVYLWPDKDGISEWEKMRNSIKDMFPQATHLELNSDFIRDNWTEADGPKADVADILLRIQRETAPKIQWDTDAPFISQESMNDPRVMEWRRRMSMVHSSGWRTIPESEYQKANEITNIKNIINYG